jgi:hypothetical protein
MVRTLGCKTQMSTKCQKPTKRVVAKTTLFDHLGAVMLTARSLGYRAHIHHVLHKTSQSIRIKGLA